MEVIQTDTEDKISAISPNSIHAKEKATQKIHIELRNGLKKRMDAIITKAFTLYQQMSAGVLRADWDDIVAEHCFTTGCLDEHDSPSNDQIGQDWKTLADCKRLHLLPLCDPDAGERHDHT